jgi:hypothetical protein
MAVLVTIDSIIGRSPYNVYICQSNGSNCFYISTIYSVPYKFDIPAPYDNLDSYMLKLVDANNCIISGTTTL